jgi:hypothetical protein
VEHIYPQAVRWFAEDRINTAGDVVEVRRASRQGLDAAPRNVE